MILRGYQERGVDRMLAALEEHGRTLYVAATGAGKTVCLSEVIRRAARRTLVLQHRDELVRQNSRTFRKLAPGVPTTLYTADEKRWSRGVTFGMVQTVTRNLDDMPELGLVVADEAHFYRAPTFQRVLDRALELNPECWVLGVTATPKRGDKRSLKATFDNVADVISVGELVRGGYLVPPRAFVMDVGITEQLGNVQVTRAGEYDAKAVEEVLNVRPVTEAVVQHWKAKAGDRTTVVFCSTRKHAREVCEAFLEAGVSAAVVDGGTKKDERRETLAAFDRREIQVLVNVSVAREGFDVQHVGCVVLLRMESHESTLIQMIGRGLRKVDPARYPGIVKTDCIVLDFGRSLLKHGGISQVFRLDADPPPKKDEALPSMAPQKRCEECEMQVPIAVRTCPACGWVFPAPEDKERDQVEDFRLIELDLMLERSPFEWWEPNPATMVASAWGVWSVVFELRGVWHTYGGAQGVPLAYLSTGAKVACVAAGDDWMRRNADADMAGKTLRWLTLPASSAQVGKLKRLGVTLSRAQLSTTSRYQAGCMITLELQRRAILHHLQQIPLPNLEEEAA